MSERPKRRAIPLSVKVEACLMMLGFDPKHVQWDHFPSLGLRPVNASGTDYDPPQHDPRYIVPMTTIAHAVKTNGPAHDKSQSDKGRIAKTKRLEANRLAAQIRASLDADSLPEWKPQWKRAWPKGRKFETRKR